MASLEAGSMEELASGVNIFPSEARMKLIRRESVTDNPLTRDVIYTQRFILHDEDKREDFLRNVHDYIGKMLNDEKFGIVFFKARVFSNKHINDKDALPADDKPVVDYRLDFHTFAEENLTDTKVRTIKEEFLPRLLLSSTGDSKPLAKLKSTDIITHEDTSLRKPRYPYV